MMSSSDDESVLKGELVAAAKGCIATLRVWILQQRSKLDRGDQGDLRFGRHELDQWIAIADGLDALVLQVSTRLEIETVAATTCQCHKVELAVQLIEDGICLRCGLPL